MKFTPFFVILSLLFAGLFAWKFNETQQLQQRLSAMEAKLAALPTVAAKSESAAATPASASKETSSKTDAPAEATAAADAPKKDLNPFAKMSKAFEEMMKSNAGKEAMAQGSKGMIEAMYKELFDLLELDPETKKAFLAALTAAQMQQQATGMKLLTDGSKSKEDRDALVKDLQTTHSEQEAKLKSILGTEEKFAQYKQYQDSTPERQQITGLKDKFSASGAPMDDALEQHLMDVMYKERKNTKWDYDYADQQDIRPEKFTQSSIDRYEKQRSEYEQRVDAKLQGTLNDAQTEALQKQREQSHLMEGMGLNFAKAIFGSDAK